MLNERQWLELEGNKFSASGDQQGMLYAQLSAILRGELGMEINEDHQQAWRAETAHLRASP